MGRRLILGPRHASRLARVAAANVLVAFDFDGTLAPIVPEPADARMRPATRRLLAAVARRYPCAVLSGRPLDDLARRLRGVPLSHLAGDHGSERPGTSRTTSPHVERWVARLRGRLPAMSGLIIEPKRYSVTVHYRRVRDRARALAAVEAAVRDLPDARVIRGALAINLLHSAGPHKGSALQQARRALACETALYVGDDDTDEDAFRSAAPDGLLSIRVGTQGASAAQYRLRSQADVDRLLTALVRLRSRT